MAIIKGAGTTIIGFEEVTKSDLETLGAKNSDAKKGIVTFDVNSYEALSKIAYLSRTTSRIFYLFNELKITEELRDNEENLKKSLKDIDFSEWLDENISFKVECERFGEHKFVSTDFEKLFGNLIIENIEKKSGYKQKVAMDNPGVIIFANIIDDNLVYGIDFCGFDTSKRDYHIFINKTAIRGNVGACLVLYAAPKKKKTILDTMASSGTIAIEAALISIGASPSRFKKESFIFKRLKPLLNMEFNKVIDSYDKEIKGMEWNIIASDPILANVMSASKNAKIAEVSDFVNCTRIDFEWLDTKLEKGNIDYIITKMPTPSKHNPEKDVEKLYKEFFYQAEYILNKKNGRLTVLIQNDELFVKVGKNYKFKRVNKLDIMIGKQNAMVTTLEFE